MTKKVEITPQAIREAITSLQWAATCLDIPAERNCQFNDSINGLNAALASVNCNGVTMPIAENMLQYIQRIRNAEKKDYAIRYAVWLSRSEEDRSTVAEPIPHGLTYMGAQAVRMALAALI